MIFGLESYNQRVLDSMKKGVELEVIDKMVEDCLRIGIAMHFYLLIGFPTETRDEVMASPLRLWPMTVTSPFVPPISPKIGCSTVEAT